MSHKKMLENAAALLDVFKRKKLTLATAESCTGGMLSMLLTEVAGSSAVLDRGFITYSNASKTELLGVKPELIKAHGAVSGEVAEAMARGALKRSSADVSVAITGVAGPGASEKKPAGLVYIAVAARDHKDVVVMENMFTGDRATVRRKSASKAMATLKKAAALV